eukprot:601979-Alexandrium_andersonii.AAC.1
MAPPAAPDRKEPTSGLRHAGLRETLHSDAGDRANLQRPRRAEHRPRIPGALRAALRSRVPGPLRAVLRPH